MQVILQEDFPSLGYVGDVVSVKPGYARNFLFPRGIAAEASSSNGKLLKHRMEGIQSKRAKLKAQAESFGKKLQSVNLEFTLKVGELGKSFGAITTRDIEAALRKEDIEVNKKQIRLVDPIKGSGTYKVEVKLHSEVTIHLVIKVTAEAPAKSAALEDGEKKPKRRSKKSEAAADEAGSSTEGSETPAAE